MNNVIHREKEREKRRKESRERNHLFKQQVKANRKTKIKYFWDSIFLSMTYILISAAIFQKSKLSIKKQQAIPNIE